MTAKDPLSSSQIVGMNREYTFFSWSTQSATMPIPMARAEGVYFWDVDGKRYIEFSCQLMNMNIGHQHPKVVRAIQEQAAQLCYAHPSMATEPRLSAEGGNLIGSREGGTEGRSKATRRLLVVRRCLVLPRGDGGT